MTVNSHRVLSMKKFFNVKNLSKDSITYNVTKPSLIIMKNVYVEWLRSIWMKAEKNYPVYINKPLSDTKHMQDTPVGIIQTKELKFMEGDKQLYEHSLNEYTPFLTKPIKFTLIVPEQDIMQYFIQWQRYRKYWWSCITTTPSLFSISDIKYYEDNKADVNIIAELLTGPQDVERVSIRTDNNNPSRALLECNTSLEAALVTVLEDGLISTSKEDYLRLQRKIAPFKMSFAIDCDDAISLTTLKELAVLLNRRLLENKILTWFPEFTLTLQEQEQVHIADFEDYAKLLFKN